MEVRFIRAGMLSTVQDLGRRGLLCEGVPLGGAVDAFALRVANLLVGNPEGAPALEITLRGPEIEFSKAGWVAACGARFADVPAWRPFQVSAGERLKFGERSDGCRCYLAVSGGFDVPAVLGGSGTNLAAAIGGFQGRALADGDVLATGPALRVPTGHWGIDERMLPRYSRDPLVRVIAGAQAADFGDTLYSGSFTVTPRSDRMGMRLAGPRLERRAGYDLISAAVAPGTIQVPPDGNPILLMADAQTLGGYPRVAHVASVDMPLVAQLAPGDRVRFAASGVAEAHALIHAQNHQLALLRHGIAGKMAPA
jgi:antagonist of KipI